MVTQFRDRRHAGRLLARRLSTYADNPKVLVLALPRGGVAVAFEVAKALYAPLDVFVVRKLGVPGIEELAMGAIASGGVRIMNESVVHDLNIPAEVIDAVAAKELEEVRRRERVYRGDRPLPDTRGRIVIVVDDGLATGATMRAAIIAVRQQQPARTVVAVPIAPRETLEEIQTQADEVVCLMIPKRFFGIGQGYQDFSQLTDVEVQALLERDQIVAAVPSA
jgi:putative phosphoribosyl transferase